MTFRRQEERNTVEHDKVNRFNSLVPRPTEDFDHMNSIVRDGSQDKNQHQISKRPIDFVHYGFHFVIALG